MRAKYFFLFFEHQNLGWRFGANKNILAPLPQVASAAVCFKAVILSEQQ